jgi:F0F1-type ATP synthase epsilon subunit
VEKEQQTDQDQNVDIPIKVVRDRARTRYAVHTGYVEVAASKVTVLAENAEKADQIDQERARLAKARGRGEADKSVEG